MVIYNTAIATYAIFLLQKINLLRLLCSANCNSAKTPSLGGIKCTQKSTRRLLLLQLSRAAPRRFATVAEFREILSKNCVNQKNKIVNSYRHCIGKKIVIGALQKLWKIKLKMRVTYIWSNRGHSVSVSIKQTQFTYVSSL